MPNTITLMGYRIQHDASGRGHAWRDATQTSCPLDVKGELACALCEDDGLMPLQTYIAHNGQRYRLLPL